MTPAALTKAKALLHFAGCLGAPVHEFQVICSAAEAYELLDWLSTGGSGPPSELLLEDIRQARIDADPWAVLQHFRLLGLEIVRADRVLQ